MPEFRGYNFDQVVNAVTDLGMDDTGGTPITNTLHNDVSGGDLVVFPDGDYLCEDDGSFWGSQGGAPIGVVAKAAWDAYNGGDTRDPYSDDSVSYDDIYTSDVNFMPKTDGGKIKTPWIGNSATMDFIMEGITLDHTNTSSADSDSGTLGISAGGADAASMDIRNIDHAGRAINYNNLGSEEIAISAGTQDTNGSVLVHGCELLESHDQTLYGDAGGRIGYYTGSSHEGTIEYNECKASEIGNNGWYCSGPADSDPPEGAVHIIDCYVENCGAAGFRICGGESKIENSEAVYDETLYDGPENTPDDGGSRPIVLETSNAGTSDGTQQTPGVTIQNTLVKMRACHKPGPAIHAYQTERKVNIIGCDIDIDGVDMSIYSPHPGDAQIGWIIRSVYNQQFGSDGPGVDPRQLNLDDTTIVVKNIPSGSASQCVVAACDADSDHTSSTTGTHIHNGTCIEASGNENAHDGVAVEYYDSSYSTFDATIENVNINVGGSAVNNIGGNNVTQSSVTTSNSCSIGDDNPTGGGDTTYSEDFSRFLDGDNLLDNWSTRWNSASSDWSVKSDPSFSGGAKLVLDADNRTRRAFLWDDMGTPADAEMAIIAHTPSSWGGTSGGSHIRPIVRGGETSGGDETGYFVAANDAEWRLMSYNTDGTTTNLATWGNPDADTRYRIRLRANADTISARTWLDGNAEPSTWDASVSDTEHSDGWAGVGSFETYDEFGYTAGATGGGTAQLPVVIPSVPVQSISGVVRSISGIVTTRSNTATETLIDSFENYTLGANLNNEAAEWGNPSDPMQVHDTAAVDGTQSVGTEKGDNLYRTAQSNTASGNVTDQTGTFSAYPYANATIRVGIYIPDTSCTLDIAFGVPETESNFNSNCYRFRGGTGTTPFLRRTVAGSSTSLASFSSALSADTYYDIAIEFEDDSTNSNVDMTARIWEWDSANSQWVEFESEITATDTNYEFPDQGGIAIGINDASANAYIDYFRFYDALGNNGAPSYTP